jgi:uncharacterized protein DUF4166
MARWADASPFAALNPPLAAQLAAPLRDQYLLSPGDRHRVRLTGRMERIWHRPRWIRPLLGLLSGWAILVPDTGTDVPAEMVVAARRDRRGRPCQVWQRSFAFGRRRRSFKGVMVYDAERRTVVERLGPGGLIQIPWRMHVLPAGGLRIDIDGIWVGPFRLPRALSADVVATEQAVDARTIQIELEVRHRLLGPVFGYEGRFEVRREPLA